MENDYFHDVYDASDGDRSDVVCDDHESYLVIEIEGCSSDC